MRSDQSSQLPAGEVSRPASAVSALRPAFVYLAVHPTARGGDSELQLRRRIAEFARLDGLQVISVFVDELGEAPYAFSAMRELLRRKPEVRTVVLPDLGHVAHLPIVAPLGRAALARFLGAAVLEVEPLAVAPDSARRLAGAGPSGSAG